VTHYYSELMVAVVQLNQGGLRVGDRIHIKGHTTDFDQTVESMEIEHQRVEQANPGEILGMKVLDHAREHDQVYKILG
jgi:putative protease